MSPFSISTADFVSLDTTGVRGPRKLEGSLPDITFMHLAAGSQFIDVGTNVGLPFAGAGPDLGAFEYGWTDAAAERRVNTEPRTFELYQNFPNPFNPATSISYFLPQESEISLAVFDVLGRELMVLDRGMKSAGYHRVALNGTQLASGVYFATLRSAQSTATVKLTLLK
jgi:hypothetical protein